jgi:hypothetical protein
MPSPEQIPNGAVIVTVAVSDVDTMHRILTQATDVVRSEPRDEVWGQRHFFAQDPAGYWIDIVQPIPPGAEYTAAYTDRR